MHPPTDLYLRERTTCRHKSEIGVAPELSRGSGLTSRCVGVVAGGEEWPGQGGHLGRCPRASALEPVDGHADDRAGGERGANVVRGVDRRGGARRWVVA